MGKCEGKHGNELPCFGRGDCDTPGCYRNRRVNCGMGDRTWKERHAKGVEMVKRSHNDVIKWYDLDYKNGSWTDGDHQFNADGTPIIEVISIQNDVWRVAATFCNFRYKPEWLEKHKKQTI